MAPHLDFELVIAGNYFTDKQKMTDKPNQLQISFFRGHPRSHENSSDLNDYSAKQFPNKIQVPIPNFSKFNRSPNEF